MGGKGSGGKNRLPTRTKVIRHTFRKDRSAKNEPNPAPLLEIPKPPSGLPRAGRRLWIRQAPQLVALGVLTTADTETFEVACREYGKAAELDHHITHVKEPETGRKRKRTVAEFINELVQVAVIEGKDEEGKPKPIAVMGTKVYERLAVVYAQLALERAALNALRDFGLTPAARSRLDLGPAEKAEPSAIKRMLNDA